jgi:hypothetical protein
LHQFLRQLFGKCFHELNHPERKPTSLQAQGSLLALPACAGEVGHHNASQRDNSISDETGDLQTHYVYRDEFAFRHHRRKLSAALAEGGS